MEIPDEKIRNSNRSVERISEGTMIALLCKKYILLFLTNEPTTENHMKGCVV